MDYRAAVTRRCCEQAMAGNPIHWAWKRERREEHGWARRENDWIQFPMFVTTDTSLQCQVSAITSYSYCYSK
ncbi:hypothetical protein GDO86_006821 [Hymenochirus boettgeri]|uniref:Uncharacterized protein n=1 Tax=Hymenochirus boettgeri TaxID=247094 RepID=A0A8T2JCI8_9PIPI|nr:hypothetical protein GDO86_006821 [Hymenochirus boettgeri]